MFSKKLWLSLSLFLCLGFSNIWSSQRYIYHPCGEESDELLRAVRSLNTPDKKKFNEEYLKIEQLSEKGDWSAFSIICDFKMAIDNAHYMSYLNHIYLKLSEDKNYSAMGIYGKILSEREDFFKALPFLNTAWENRQHFRFSLEDLEYNYITVLCNIDSVYLDDISKLSEYYEKAWQLSQAYLSKQDKEYQILFFMLFHRLKVDNQERFINKIGHFIYDQNKGNLFQIYTEIFAKTPHLERLFRQRNSVAFEWSSRGVRENDGIADRKARKEKFKRVCHQHIQNYATQEVLKILATEAIPKQDLKNFGVERVDQLTSNQKNIFGRYLIYGFEDRLFPVGSMDIEEYMEKYIPAKSDKQKFLVENVLVHLKGY